MKIELFGEGLEGVIIGDTSQLSAVEFDEEIIEGHSCNGTGRDGDCRWVHREMYEDILI